MLLESILVVFIVATNSAPAPYYTSLIETPTSRVQQYFFMGSRQDESYRLQQQQSVPQIHLQIPKQQTVYYYHQPQQQDVYHAQQPLNLHGLRQDSPFWQEWFNQISKNNQIHGQGSEDLTDSGEEGNSQESLEGINVNSDVEISSSSLKPVNNAEENFFIKPSETESTTSKNQLGDQQKNSSADIKKNSDLDSDHETTSNPLQSLNDNEEMNKKASELTSELTIVKQSGESEILDIRRTTNENDNQGLKKVKAAMHRLFYKIDDQYYVLSGSPEFYGNTDPRSLMISIQALQPLKHDNENKNDKNNGQEQKIAPLPKSSAEPTSTFNINVVEEDEGEEEKKETHNKESVQISAPLQLPSDDQSSMEMEKGKTSHNEEKQEQTASEGE